MFRPLACSILLLVLVPTLLAEDKPDSHFAAPSVSAICHRSAFYHGYLHGYEAGFNEADNDYQMAHEPQDPARAKAFKNVGWKKEYGDRSNFELGYRSGFVVGYIDSFNDRDFRAVTAVRDAVGDKLDGTQLDRNFDQGVADGYSFGVQRGLSDARSGVRLDTSDHSCAISKGPYCNGYSAGYRLGYGDGYSHQQAPAVAKATPAR